MPILRQHVQLILSARHTRAFLFLFHLNPRLTVTRRIGADEGERYSTDWSIVAPLCIVYRASAKGKTEGLGRNDAARLAAV
jgi:hypothetical protein